MIEVVTHYLKEDPECLSDYSDVEVFINGEYIISFGDYYHDKGREKADAFVEGWNFCLKHMGKEEHKVRFSEKADREY